MHLSTQTLQNDVSQKHSDENKAGRIFSTVLCRKYMRMIVKAGVLGVA